MSKTRRTIRIPGSPEQATESQCRDESKRWRADRNERLTRAQKDAKRLERAERHSALRDAESRAWSLGSTVRMVTP